MSLIGKLALSVLPALLAVAGGTMAYKTYEGRERAETVSSTAESAVADLTPDAGLRRVTGIARVADESVTAGMLSRQGVATATTVEERSAREMSERAGSMWEPVYEETKRVPFVLADDTGEAIVDPTDARLETERVTEGSEADETPSGAVREWVTETDGIDPAPDQTRQFEQGVIESGETVVVVGQPVARDGEVTLAAGDAADEFVVSDMSAEKVADETGYSATSYAIGGVLGLIGVGGLALLWL